MKKIVIITTPGTAKRIFVNTLHHETNGAVQLVIIQKSKGKDLRKRILQFYKKVGMRGILPEVYHYLSIQLNTKRKEALGYAKLSSLQSALDGYVPPTYEVNDINDPSVYERLQSISPDIIAIWGGLIVKPHIISCAQIALNMHAGYCPYYRGTNCNYHAILNNDFAHIGVTIHDVATKVDAGDIRKVVTVNTHQAPRAFFTELNDTAIREYLDVIKHLARGERVASTPQDLSLGKNYMLKEWTYKKQHLVADRLIALEDEYASKA